MRYSILLACLLARTVTADEPKPAPPAGDPPGKADPRELMKDLGKATRLDRTGQIYLRDRTVIEFEISQRTAECNKLLANKKIKKAYDLLEDASAQEELNRSRMAPADESGKLIDEFLKKYDLDRDTIKLVDALVGLQEQIAADQVTLRTIEGRLTEHEKKGITAPPIRVPSVSTPRGAPDADEVRRRYAKTDAEPDAKPKPATTAPPLELDHIFRKIAPRKQP